MADPTPEVVPTRYRVRIGTYGADVVLDPATDKWAVQSPAVTLVQSALQSMGLLNGAVPDPAGFRYPTHEVAETAALTVLAAANTYMGAVLSTRPTD